MLGEQSAAGGSEFNIGEPLATADSEQLARLNKKNAWRILPFLFVGYVLCSLDKSNVGFAALEMNKALGFSAAVFGLGASLFFVTYTIFEVPSNLLMRRYGARIWLSRILITWGLISAATAFTHDQTSFYLFRLALGVAEAGWFPGILFYMCYWFPQSFRARAVMLCFIGFPISAVIGNPISGALLSLPTIAGLVNWQWLFIVEGLPCVLLGIFGLFWLKDTPADAAWLTAHEKRVLTRALSAEQSSSTTEPRFALVRTLFNPHVMLFSLINFLAAIGMYGIIIWIPRLVKNFGGLTNLQVGFLSAVPFVFGGIALAFCAYNSDRMHDRKWHVSGSLLIGAVAMACTFLTTSPVAMMICLTIAMVGPFGVAGAWYAMITEALRNSTEGNRSFAVSIALITGLGNLGGFVGPYGIGLFVTAFGDFKYALLGVASALAIGGLVVAICRKQFLEPAPRQFRHVEVPGPLQLNQLNRVGD
jgi:ACS family tartrate transporter-like MFS transporter